MLEFRYNREKAVQYARDWAYRRNPRFYDFEDLGGDCTNFASQCVYAGAEIMNYTPVFGWFYIDLNNRTPSWTGVEYFYNFMVNNTGAGPFVREVPLYELMPGDVVQLKFAGPLFGHTPVVVDVRDPVTPDNIYVAAHTYDADYRPLSTYHYTQVRALHVVGVRAPK